MAKSTTHKEFKDRCVGLHETGDGNRIRDGSPFLNILQFLYFLNFFCFPAGAAPNSSTIATAIESRTASALCA